MSTPVLVWFRNDLRLSDHPALLQACQVGSVIPVFIWDPEAEAPWQPGAASRWWLHFSLQSLAQDLQHRGSRLIMRSGPTEQILQELLRQTQAKTIFANRRYEPVLRALDQDLSQRLPLQYSLGNLLQEPWQIQTGSGGPYKVFTPYWRSCLKLLQPQVFQDAPQQLPAVDTGIDSDTLESLGLLPRIPWDTQMQVHWQIGERAAQTRLNAWLRQGLADYAENRNFPGIDKGTSGLAAHLHFGEITPRQIWQAVKHAQLQYPDLKPEVFLSEIGWREFSHHILFHFPHTSDQALNSRFDSFPWREDQVQLRAWQKGLTGYPIVDAGMRELWAHGTMHNRVRMIVASFLSKDLLLAWQHGAQWFWDTLVDADLAANSFNWQWAAGCGADAAPFFRIFNPITQGQKFDPQGDYVRRWVPELRKLPNKYLHQPWTSPADILNQAQITLGIDYPLPIVDHAEARQIALMAFKGI